MKQWLTVEQLRDERIFEIGYNPNDMTIYKITDYYQGDAYLVAGMTGYGKSILAGNIAVELAQHRALIIFDYKGDYKFLKYINMHNKHNRFKSIPDLVYLHRFGFKLQDFRSPFDWQMLGLKEGVSKLFASKARQVFHHKNDFKIFREMIEEVQTYAKGKEGEAFYMTKQSALDKLNTVKTAFVDDNNSIDITDMHPNMIKYSGISFYVSDWKKFLKRNTHTCLNMNSEFNPAKAQLFAGKIMTEMESMMQELNPVILIEEAHILCPETYDSEVPYSLIKVLHYLKELHKKGVKLVLVTQYPHQLQREALDEIKRFFIGKLQNVRGFSKLDDMFKTSSILEYNVINDHREFWHYSPLYNEKGIFVPYDSYTYYEKRK